MICHYDEEENNYCQYDNRRNYCCDSIHYRPLWIKADIDLIEQRYTLFQKAIENGRFADAYVVMSPEYKTSHDLQVFTNQFKGAFSSSVVSRKKSTCVLEQC